MTVPDISIVIVNYQGRKCIGRCLESIPAAIGRYHCETIVVDNASNDGSVEFIRDQFPEVTLVLNSINEGYSKACNLGITRSKGRYFCMLNPDLYLHERALEILIDFLARHPDVGAISPRLLNSDGTMQPICRDFMKNWNLMLKHVVPWGLFPQRITGRYILEYWDHNSIRDVDWFCGACMVFPRSMLYIVGLKDEDFWSFHEDTDWLTRVHECGYRVVFNSEATGVHEGGHSMKQVFRNAKILFEFEAKHLVVRKYYGPRALFFHRMLFAGLLMLRRLSFSVTSNGSVEDQERIQLLNRCIKLQLNLVPPPPLPADHHQKVTRAVQHGPASDEG